jgi:hypothetical protein
MYGQGKEIHENKINNTFEDLKKPVFINSSKLQKENEVSDQKLEISDPNEFEHKKGIPISKMLNVPMNKIDQTIHNSKEKYIQQQMINVNMSSSSKVDDKEVTQINLSVSNISQFSNNNSEFLESTRKSPETPNNSKNTNLIINPQQYQQNPTYPYPQVQTSYPHNNNPYYNMQRSAPMMYNSYTTIQQAPQQKSNFKYSYNMPVMQPVVNPQMNYINPQINQQINQINTNTTLQMNTHAQPLYNNSQLTNYYSTTVPINYMFPNYNHLNVQTEQFQPEPAELDVKEFSDKLNLNAKVYIPKNKVYNFIYVYFNTF